MEEQDSRNSERIERMMRPPILWWADEKTPADMFAVMIDDDVPQTILIGAKHRDLFPEIDDEDVTDGEREMARRIQNRIDTELNRIYEMEDDRLLALVSALLIEEATDSLLGELMPGYRKLKAKRDFTHALKTDVLRALHLVPFTLVRNADFVRKIRNEFAHNLQADTFASLKRRLLEDLERYCLELSSEYSILETHAQRFTVLVSSTAANLYLHVPGVQSLNELLRDDRVFLHWAYDELKRRKEKDSSA